MSIYLWCLFLISYTYNVVGVQKIIDGAEKKLYRKLMRDYEPSVRPVILPNTTVVVHVGVKVNQLLDLNERTQVLTSIVAIDQSWNDEYLTWNPAKHLNIKNMYLPCSKVWLPDLVLYNGVESIHKSPYMQSPISVDYKGHVTWFPLAKLQTSCKVDTRFYPFDHQACYLKLGSWSYSIKEVDIQDGGYTGIEKPDYIDNGEFELLKFEVERVRNNYDCCPHPIITLNIKIIFKRRPMFSMFTVAIPCILLSTMTVIAFILPPQNEAKIEVQLSVMLSLAVFMLMIGESMPPTSEKVPLIGIHIVIQMSLTAMSLISSVFVLRLVHTDYVDVSERWRKRIVTISKWLCLGIPDYLKDDYQIEGKLSRLEKHQVELRQNYLDTTTQDKTNPDSYGIKKGLLHLKGQTAKLMVRSYSSSDEGFTGTKNKEGDNEHNYKTESELMSLVSSVTKILEHLEDNVLKDQRRAEWLILGALLDRLLLLILICTVSTTTIYIYIIAPMFDNDIILE